ncbi:MAG: hypothetical protein ABS52_07435 [Gemmatimonadetes bacterium SCN 70-22]|jgi:hypothetical protein|nr:MAG: hypothetical protein ABS52_07435 [Gemmatimonadetes bacterium SCN 70-22]
MGLETNCTLERDRRKVAGKALLETDHIAFRGRTQRITLALTEVLRVEVQGDALVLEYEAGPVRLHLATGMAMTWLARIRNPRSLMDKLGVKEGMTVVVLGVTDGDFLQQLERRVGRYATQPATPSDVILLGAESTDELARLAALRAVLVPNGAIWVVHRKGKEATLRDVDVFAAGRRAGLVDNKVVAFSATHTAERLVIPRSER